MMKGEVESDGYSGIICRSEKLKLSLTLIRVGTIPKKKESRAEKVSPVTPNFYPGVLWFYRLQNWKGCVADGVSVCMCVRVRAYMCVYVCAHVYACLNPVYFSFLN